MVNSIYSSAVALTVSILIVGIFTFNIIQRDNSRSDNLINGHKYIKTKDRVVSVPRHIFEAILTRYKTRLINLSKDHHKIKTYDMNYIKSIHEVENALADHIRIKYGIKYNLCPMEFDIYIFNQGVPKADIYDEELVGGVDMTPITHSLGKIIWYLEKIILQNRTHKNSIEIPLVLEKIDNILATKPKSQGSKISSSYDLQIMAGNNVDGSNENTPAVIDVLDGNEQLRLPTKSTPKKCSAILRNNLHDFISDSAAQDWVDISPISDGGNQKAKNMREATAGWQKTNIFRMADISHARDSTFDDNYNQQLNPYITYANYDLPFKMMKDDLKNRISAPQKQSLTDDWDYLEQQFLSN